VAAALASGLNHLSVAAAAHTTAARLGWALDRPVTFALQGPQEHLWFLPALAIGLAALAAARAAGLRARTVVALGLALYAVALLAGPYSRSSLGLHLAVNPRNGPFGSVLFVAMGALLGERESARDGGNGLPAGRGAAWALLVCGLAATLAEALVLRRLGVVPAAHDALLGLVLAGPGLFLVARTATCAVHPGLVRLGQLTLGVYAAHALVAMPLSRLAGHFPGFAGEIALPVLVLALTAVLAVAMARAERLRPFVA
jgi:surface polysaccharide O-acyltransferase-like enzyme